MKNQTLPTGEGQKMDMGKPQFRLIPPLAEREIAEVLSFGAQKYAPDNWRKVCDAQGRYLDAALRHINAYRAGAVYDDESKRKHLAHACVSLMFIIELMDESEGV